MTKRYFSRDTQTAAPEKSGPLLWIGTIIIILLITLLVYAYQLNGKKASQVVSQPVTIEQNNDKNASTSAAPSVKATPTDVPVSITLPTSTPTPTKVPLVK